MHVWNLTCFKVRDTYLDARLSVLFVTHTYKRIHVNTPTCKHTPKYTHDLNTSALGECVDEVRICSILAREIERERERERELTHTH